METFENIKKYRLRAGLSQDELAKKTGYNDRSSIAKIESGKVDLSESKILLFAKALGVSPATLMGITENPLPSNILPMLGTYKVPRLGRIACGDPILAEENIEDYDTVPEYVKCDFTLVCKGDSMINARIFDGDIVCIKSQSEVSSGDIAAVMVGDDEATLKRVRLYPDHIVLEPENPLYKPMVFWEEEMNTVRIIGKATHFISRVR